MGRKSVKGRAWGRAGGEPRAFGEIRATLLQTSPTAAVKKEDLRIIPRFSLGIRSGLSSLLRSPDGAWTSNGRLAAKPGAPVFRPDEGLASDVTLISKPIVV